MAELNFIKNKNSIENFIFYNYSIMPPYNATREVMIKKRPTPQEKKMKRIANQQAKKVLNTESDSKFFDGKLAFAGQNVDYNGYLVSLFSNVPAGTTITQGSGVNQYVGNRIRPTHISFRADISNDLADPINTVTIVLLQAKKYFQPGATLANIFESTGNFSAPLSPMNQSYDDRLKVLSRKTFALSTVSGNNHVVYKKEININKLAQVVFNDAAGQVEIGTLMLGIISDSSSSVHPLIRAQWRVHYKDI